MRIEDKMGNYKVMASTHNFLNTWVARGLNLYMKVRVANGEQIICQGKYEKVVVQLQGNNFMIDFYFIPLPGIDKVLGIQYLETLGTVNCDWKRLTMTFMWNQHVISLQGIRNQSIHNVTFDELSIEDRQQHTPILLVLIPFLAILSSPLLF